jgi:hypothetical protein
MKSALFSSIPLHNDAGIFVHQYAHFVLLSIKV